MDGTLESHVSPIVETAITSRPAASATGRPMRSMIDPTTITSAYIPSTWAPMIGNTSDWW